MNTPAIQRIRHYLAERKKMPILDQEDLHGLNIGHPTREAELRASDIQSVIADNEQMAWLIRQILTDLPQKRDWLNPDYEREMRLIAEQSKPAEKTNTPVKVVADWDPVRMADVTRDAYSSESYTSWEQCCRVLRRRGYSAIEAEAILRSKWMRWARDVSGKLEASSKDLESYLDRYAGKSGHNVDELVASYGEDYRWSYQEGTES